MVVRYNLSSERRKEFVKAVGRIAGIQPKYMRTPTFAYKIGDYTVTKDGNLDIFDRADSEEVENMIERLDSLGFTAEQIDYLNDGDSKTEDGDIKIFSTEITLSKNTLSSENFSNGALEKMSELINSKQKLFQKALNTSLSLDIEESKTTVTFPWFEGEVDTERLTIYTDFIKALYNFCEKANRINKTHNEIENEKFAMRTFLNRIGLSGTEYKGLRKELLQNLDGNSAFRYGKKDGDNK